MLMSNSSYANGRLQDRSFSRWLCERRQAQDFTQEELAEQAGCSVQMIRKLEAGEARPSPALAARLTACLVPPPIGQVEVHGHPFGLWLGQVRKAQALTQAELAQQADCSLSTIKRLEQGRLRPSRELAATLAQLLDIPFRDRPRWLQQARVPAAAGGPSVPPPRRTNLPPLFLPLIGRTQEMARIATCFTQEDRRLVTLTGPAGIGKTRLALYAATALDAAFTDGIWWVPLATLTDPALLEATISRALDLHEGGGPPGVALLRPYLRHRQILLVLDNFEHLVAAGSVLADLLGRAPGLRLLVTSRLPLHLATEVALTLPPLALPPRHALPALPDLVAYPAIQLFLQGARVADAAFQLTPANVELVAAICTRLEGVPLAIELAAVRIRLAPLAVILAGLDHPLTFLTDESTERPRRHQAVRHALAWSYDLLQPTDQLLFAGLGVFARTATLAAVAAVVPPLLAAARNAHMIPHETLLQGLERLLAHHLLQRADTAFADPQFTMLETVQAYALEQLQHQSLLALAQQYHAAYYLTLAEQSDLTAPDGLNQLERALENFRAIFTWTLADNAAPVLAGQLATALGGFWETRGYWQEGHHWLTLVLTQAEWLPATLVAQLRYGAGRLAYLQGDYQTAAPLLHASLAADPAAVNSQAALWALNTLGWIAYSQGNYAQARVLYEQSLVACQVVADRRAEASTLNSLAAIALMLADATTAEPLLRASLALRQAAEDQQGVVRSLNGLGLVAHSREEYAQAQAYFIESIALARTLGDKLGVSLGLANLGWVCVAAGDPGSAQLYLAEALGLAREVGSRWNMGLTLCYLGWTALQQGQVESAAPLLAESLAIAEAQPIHTLVVLCRLGQAQVALHTQDPSQAALHLQVAHDLRHQRAIPLTPFEQQAANRLTQAVVQAQQRRASTPAVPLL